MRRKKVYESVRVYRHMKTYAELEDGTLVEYSLSGGHEDEYGCWQDEKSYNWFKIQNKIEAENKKKIVASVEKMWECTSEYKRYTKGDNITIEETVKTNRKELVRRTENVRIQSERDWTRAFCTVYDLDASHRWDKKYAEHFGLRMNKYGEITTDE